MQSEEYLQIELVLKTKSCYQINDEESLVFVSMTGRGKSTLINYLIGNHGKGITGSICNTFLIDSEAHDNKFPTIGNSSHSETLEPKEYKSGNMTYYNVPGLLDTKGSIRQFEIAFYHQKLFTSLKKFKIILVLNAKEDLLSTKDTNLLATIKEFSGLIDAFLQIKTSFMFVVTKVKDLDIEEIKEILQIILEENGVSGQSAEILKYLMRSDSQIGIFHTPTDITELGLEVEQQKYENCGPEVIENFIYYLTGSRLSQEEAIELHSKLIEFNLTYEFDSCKQEDALREFYFDFLPIHEEEENVCVLGCM